MRHIRENTGFRQCSQSAIPTPFFNQISLSGELITFQDCKQQEAEIKMQLVDKLNQILSEFLDLEDEKYKGALLLRRKIFIEIGKEAHLQKFIVEWLNQYSHIKVITDLLQSYQGVDHYKQEIVHRGLNNHQMKGYCNFQSSCKLERFKVKTVNPVLTITKK